MKCKKQFFTALAVFGAALTLTAQQGQGLAPVEAKAEAAKVAEPVKAEAVKAAEPVKAEAAKVAEPVKAEAAKAAEPVKPDPTVAMVDQSIQQAEQEKQAKKHVVYKASKLIPYVLITADYEIPRIFAETARKQLNVPYIILLDNSKTPTAETEAVFFSPKAIRPMWIKAKDISKLLAYMRARDVIILGNSDYVPAFYQKAVPATSRKILVNSADWRLNAVKLSSIMNTDKITEAFETYRDRRAAELEQKRSEYENDKRAKAQAIEKASRSEQALIDAAAY